MSELKRLDCRAGFVQRLSLELPRERQEGSSGKPADLWFQAFTVRIVGWKAEHPLLVASHNSIRFECEMLYPVSQCSLDPRSWSLLATSKSQKKSRVKII